MADVPSYRPFTVPSTGPGETVFDEAKRGAVASKYRLIELVEAGGMGRVFKAHDTVLDRVVALKVPHEGQSHADFMVERQLAAELWHPDLLTALDAGELPADGQFITMPTPFFVMPLIKDYTDLGAASAEELGSHRWIDAVRRVSLVAKALHVGGVAHGDIQPRNVLVTANGALHVIDLGLARRGDAPARAGGVEGFRAPELLAGQAASPAGDVYALGALLAKVSTGHANGLPRDPPMRSLVRACTALDAGSRPTAAQLASDLERWLVGELPRLHRAGCIERARWWAARQPRLAGTLVVVGALMFGSIGWAYYERTSGIRGRAEEQGRLAVNEARDHGDLEWVEDLAIAALEDQAVATPELLGSLIAAQGAPRAREVGLDRAGLANGTDPWHEVLIDEDIVIASADRIERHGTAGMVWSVPHNQPWRTPDLLRAPDGGVFVILSGEVVVLGADGQETGRFDLWTYNGRRVQGTIDRGSDGRWVAIAGTRKRPGNPGVTLIDAVHPHLDVLPVAGVHHLAFDQSVADHLVTLGDDGLIRWWDLGAYDRRVGAFRPPSSLIGLSFDLDADLLTFREADGAPHTVYVLDWPMRSPHMQEVYDLRILRVRGSVISIDESGIAAEWAPDGTLVRSWHLSTQLRSVQEAPDGSVWLFSFHTQPCFLLSNVDGPPIPFDPPEGFPNAVYDSVVLDDRLLVVVGSGQPPAASAWSWQASGGSAISELSLVWKAPPTEQSGTGVDRIPGGDVLMVDLNGDVVRRAGSSGRELARVRLNQGTGRLSFSSLRVSGSVAWVGASDGTLRRVDIATMTELPPVDAAQHWVQGLAAVPSGGVVSGGRDGSLRVWDSNGDPIAWIHEAHDGVVWTVGREAQDIWTSGADGRVRRWPGLATPTH